MVSIKFLNLIKHFYSLQLYDSNLNSTSFIFREHKDQALVSLAAVLYHANYSHESLVLLHAAMDTGNELSLYHFLLGNIYAVSYVTVNSTCQPHPE